ncbi:MAG TPA: PEP-CTERM sorting domain-containing protein [Gemmatirosa sp.]|jgi:hypothetical protein|nr:PEP-CTERM sorting domain-containing protein [Gemmatirosa sp.]
MIRTGFTKVAMMATLSLGAIAASATTAAAQSGLLNVAGQARLTASGPEFAAPLFIDFLSGTTFPPGTVGFGTPGNVFSGTNTGIFTSVAPGTVGVMNDLTVSPTMMMTQPAGGSLLTIGAYTFAVGPVQQATGGGFQFGPINLTQNGNNVDAALIVRGTVMGGACSPMCNYDGIVTTQFAGTTIDAVVSGINMGNSPVVTFSGNFTANVVPEPSTYALMATGLLGLAGFASRRRRAQA